ncbi:hypothetical protein GCM10025771_30890 [Niveibacterium umoris]
MLRAGLAAIVLVCSFAQAAEIGALDSDFSLHGFGTLGIAYSSQAGMPFIREISQNIDEIDRVSARQDSRLGLQLNYRLLSDLELVGQVVARDKVNNTLNNSVEWAFGKWEPIPATTFRLGRVGLDLFLLSDQRNISYTYSWVRPPVEFYGWLPLYSLDGGDVTWWTSLGEGQLKTKFFAGRSQAADVKLTSTPIQFAVSPAVGLNISWENLYWRWRLGYTRSRLDLDYAAPSDLTDGLQMALPVWPQAATLLDAFKVRDTDLTYTGIGASYDDGRWQVIGELSRTSVERLSLPRGNKAYLSVGYRFGAWLPYVMYANSTDHRSITLAQPANPLLTPLWAAGSAAINQRGMTQRTWSFGARGDVANNVALKFQIDSVSAPPEGRWLWYRQGAGLSDVTPLRVDTCVLTVTVDVLF